MLLSRFPEAFSCRKRTSLASTYKSAADTSTAARTIFLRSLRTIGFARSFGLPEESPLPLVRHETLAAYFDYLMAHLSLPFEALYCQQGGEMRQLIYYVHVTELVDPRRSRNHSLHGLLCKAKNHKDFLELPLAEFGVQEDSPNCQLIDDYAYWFVNCR